MDISNVFCCLSQTHLYITFCNILSCCSYMQVQSFLIFLSTFHACISVLQGEDKLCTEVIHCLSNCQHSCVTAGRKVVQQSCNKSSRFKPLCCQTSALLSSQSETLRYQDITVFSLHHIFSLYLLIWLTLN